MSRKYIPIGLKTFPEWDEYFIISYIDVYDRFQITNSVGNAKVLQSNGAPTPYRRCHMFDHSSLIWKSYLIYGDRDEAPNKIQDLDPDEPATGYLNTLPLL